MPAWPGKSRARAYSSTLLAANSFSPASPDSRSGLHVSEILLQTAFVSTRLRSCTEIPAGHFAGDNGLPEDCTGEGIGSWPNAFENGVYTLYALPLWVDTSHGSLSKWLLKLRASTPAPSNCRLITESIRIPRGSYRRFQKTWVALHSVTNSMITESASPLRINNRDPTCFNWSSRSRKASPSHQRELVPSFSKPSSTTYSGTTEAPSSMAAHHALLSSSRKSFRNQTIAVFMPQVSHLNQPVKRETQKSPDRIRPELHVVLG